MTTPASYFIFQNSNEVFFFKVQEAYVSQIQILLFYNFTLFSIIEKPN